MKEEIEEKKEEPKEEKKEEIKEEIEERKEENIKEEDKKEESKEEIDDRKEEKKEELEKKEEPKIEEKEEKREDNIEEQKIEQKEEKKEEPKIEIEEEVKEKINKEEKEKSKKENKVEKEEDSIDIISEKEPELKNEIIDNKKEENDKNEIEKENRKEDESQKEKEKEESKIISEKGEMKESNNEIKNQEEGQFEEIENKKEEEKEKINYKIDYYRENIFNLLNQIENDIPLNDVPDFLKRGFAMNESIYNEQFHLKGIFPKIIISKSLEEENKIKGMLSFYYENNEDLNENLIIRINSILVSKENEEQIIEMIKYIINNVENDKIIVYVLYDKIEDKFVANKEAKELFENKLKFKWFCVVRDEKMNQRYIKYYYSKKEENYDINDNHELTKAENAVMHNKNNFMIDNLMITSINQENNNNLLKQNLSKKMNYNKFININSLYYLLLQNNNIKIDFNDETKKNELFLMSEKVMKYSKYENDLEKSKIIRNNKDEVDKSIYEEIKKNMQLNNIECSANLLKTNLFINFESNYSMIIDQIYYNRISSDKIKILEEEKTGAKFYLIPSKDNNILFYISEINNKLKELLLDNTKNVYEKFLELQPSTQKQIFEFSLKSYRDVSYIPFTPRDVIKTIYIPCFSFKTHLYTYDFKDLKNTIKLTEKDNDSPLSISSIDEYINIEFKPDNNIKNSFNIIESHDLIINNSFIMGIFDNEIINEQKLPLLQFLYVTKDNFLTKSNDDL